MVHKVNINTVPVEPTCAHGGEGLIRFCRLVESSEVKGAVNFIDLAELPPGVSIGRHSHEKNEEEYYLILEGTGWMHQNGTEFEVSTGDLIRNPPGGTHSLVNTGDQKLRIFVFEVAVV
jgi:mannose-6-phosphate isomerase-like protein (cupin superfamily)